MYCVNCGVKLADTEKTCPLCDTRVFHPDLKQGEAEELYPPKEYPHGKSYFFIPHIIVSTFLLISVIIALICDIQLNEKVVWSGYVIGALVTSYVFILPAWFKKPNPVIFVPCDFAIIGVFLLYICLETGGKWFLPFAFPVTGGIMLIVTACVALIKYVKRGFLYIIGGGSIALGAFMLLTEFLLVITFEGVNFIGWYLYPLVTLGLFGALLIFLAICRPARQSMERRFFI